MIDTEIVIYLIFLLLIFIFVWLIYIQLRLDKIFKGKKADNLEDIIRTLVKLADQQEKKNKKIDENLSDIDTRLKNSIKRPEILRFNPFKGAGSNQSFSAAFLNEENDGVVISSLYLREGTSVYAKPIKSGNSEYSLTDEEKRVLNSAKKK